MTQADRDPFDDIARDLRLRAHFTSGGPTPDCLDEGDIAAFLDGALKGDERARVVTHLASCDRCRAMVRGTAGLAADPLVAREMPHFVVRRKWSVPGVAVAAAVIIVLVALPSDSPPDDEQLREPAITATIAPVALSPRGTIARPGPLVWTSVPGAQRYRVRLQRSDGSLLWSAQTGDTSMRMPDSLRLARGTTYFWQVEAQTEWQRRVASELTRFAIGAGSR